jgi:hypothetical protein
MALTPNPLVEIIPAGKNLARRKQAATGGMTVINDALTEYIDAITIADRWSQESEYPKVAAELPTLVGVRGSERTPTVFDALKRTHARLLPDCARATFGHLKLVEIMIMPPKIPVSYDTAIEMLGVLYGALSKRKKDEDATAMMACAELFNPIDSILGESTGLWESVPKHPLILALAVKARIAKSPFVSPSELRTEMITVWNKLGLLFNGLDRSLEWLRKADRHLFDHDRAAWEVAYTRVGSDVPLHMPPPGCWEDEDEPYRHALEKLWKVKAAAESLPAAACKAKPMKRTRKAKE